MKIAIDARAILWTGIATYVKSLLAQYAHLPSEHTFTVLIPDTWQEQARSLLQLPEDRFTLVPVSASYYSWKEQTTFLRQLERLDVDLVHFTHFNVPVLYRRPYVVTIHDATRFIFPGQKHQGVLKQGMYERVFSHALSSAQHVIFVTEHTRQEVEQLPLPKAAHSHVIHEAVSDVFFEPVSQLSRQKVRSLIDTREPYLLYVGVWMGHKNLRRLLEAFVEVRKHHPTLRLVITGKPVPGYATLLEYVRTLHIEDAVIFPGYVSAALLPALYAESSCFVFPSLYEGFGLPPLEAAAVGVPVVSSNVSSLPEVLGDAAVYVNPEYVPGIAAGIRSVLEDSSLRERIISSGSTQAARYSWKEAAKAHLDVYGQVK